jgi:Rps23 Pro-64 3,4-dihydroxylase Tpa1-like proline 4-hydroxylase
MQDSLALTFQFNRETLRNLAPALKQEWINASPFPHIMVDDLFPSEVLDAVLTEYPGPEDVDWQRFDAPTEVKLAIADTMQMGSTTRHLLNEMNGQVFLEFLESVTGIDGLVPDPHLWGGGLHQIRRGGFLKVHADFNKHKKLKLDRRLNALIYLNKNWPDSYKGHLELWDKTMASCAKRILPQFNRLVVFATTDFSYHGHPDPIECPTNRARRSLALYYYTNGRPAEEITADHTTLFQHRPGESFEIRKSAKDVLRRWIPPAISDLLRKK